MKFAELNLGRMNGEIIKGKFVEYSGDHSVEANHSKIDKQTEKISNSSNGRLFIAA